MKRSPVDAIEAESPRVSQSRAARSLPGRRRHRRTGCSGGSCRSRRHRPRFSGSCRARFARFCALSSGSPCLPPSPTADVEIAVGTEGDLAAVVIGPRLGLDSKARCRWCRRCCRSAGRRCSARSPSRRPRGCSRRRSRRCSHSRDRRRGRAGPARCRSSSRPDRCRETASRSSVPFSTIRMRPSFSTMKRRLLPSPALVTTTGVERPEATGTSSSSGGSGNPCVRGRDRTERSTVESIRRRTGHC